MSEEVDDTLPAATADDRPGRHERLATASLTRGSVVGRYLLLDELGAGGMGVVWAAYDPELHRRVAVKFMQPRTGASSGGHARMLREAQALAQLSHPNVVAVYDVGSFESGVFLAMELVEGETLASWLKSGARSWKACVAVFVAAGRGLAAAHAGGLVHRDFKPSNVLVGKDGRVRVLDFGIARASRDSAPVIDAHDRGSRNALQAPLTQTGSVIGTPLYMAPEALRGDVVGPAGDQFSFCVALYEALCGELPFGERKSGDELPALRPPPSDRDVPSWLYRAVVRGLDLRPEYRYSSMDALLAAITDDPAVRRRRVAVGLAGIAVAAALVVGAMTWRTHVRAEQLRDDPCANAAPLAGVWDDAAREHLHQVFQARGNNTDVAFTRAATAFDDASHAWLTARAHTCARTRVEHEQPESMLLVRLACLDDQRDHLAALVERFDGLPASGLEPAVLAGRRMPSPDACTEARSLATSDAPPLAQAAAVALLRSRLLHEWVLERTTRRTATTGTDLRQLLADARALGYRPVIAEVALELCITLGTSPGRSETIDACEDALAAAVAAQMDTQAAYAAASRAFAGAVAGAKTELVRRWLNEAAAWVTRTGDPSSEYQLWEARAYATTSVDEAIVDHRHAIEIADRLYGESSDFALGTESNLATALSLAGRTDEAIPVQERTIRDLERSFGPRGDSYAQACDNYGVNLVFVGRFADSRTMLERALATPEASKFTLAASRCDLARVDLADGHVDAAIADGERGVAELRAIGMEKLGLAVNEDPLAAAYLAAKRDEDARALAAACVDELARDGGHDRVEMVPCLAIEGQALVQLGKPSDAASRLERAHHLLDGQPAAPGQRAGVQFQLARALVASGGDRARADELVSEARAELTKYPFLHAQLAELDAWGRDHVNAK